MAMDAQLADRIFSSTRDVIWLGLLPLALLLALAAWTDLRHERIPNRLVGVGMAFALTLHVLLPQGEGFVSQLPGGLGLLSSLAGLAIGLLLLFPCYLLRLLGAGDVKLVAMVGAFLGPEHIWGALICIAVVGGLFAVAVALYRRVLRRMVDNVAQLLLDGALQVASGRLPAAPALAQLPATARLPYGIAIALGTCTYLALALFSIGVI